ncbi:nesprin-4 isoform X9 [Lutra lutra]|uniref:nesprin-4 isoform X9 n=1 Tax=Lutra lutra TaxID=9657 RepID=UPI001FD4180C|nr:nesprin-4 isoform X9 [Lutra lutra]
MALPPPLGPRPLSEPLNHPPGAPRELDIAGFTLCPASEERLRPDQAQELGQDSLDPPQHLQGGLGGTELTAGPLRLPTPTSSEDAAGGKHCEHLSSGQEVLEAEQDSLALCLLGLGLRLRDLERGLGPWASAQSRMGQLQVLRALRAHRGSIFRRLWWLQAQLVFEEVSPLDQDLEVEGDLDGPGPGEVWGPWAPSSYPTPAELEWDPAGDVGGLRPLWQKTAWTPGAPCELCGHRGPQGRGQGLEFSQGPHTSVSPQDMLMSGFSHWKHLAGQRRRSLLWKSQDKKRASPNLQGVMLEVDPGAPPPASGHSLIFLLLLLFFLLVGATLLLPPSGGSCCSSARLAGTPYLVLSYVNGPPPI